MLLKVSMLSMLLVAILASAASAATPLDGQYWNGAALSSKPQILMQVARGSGSVTAIAKVRCLRGPANLPRNTFPIRGGSFRVTIPLAFRLRGAGTPPDRLIVTGRWTSGRSVSGKLRLVLRQRPRAADARQRHGWDAQEAALRYCDSGSLAWRAALTHPVSVRSTQRGFSIPGTSTTTVTVRNDGDYPSPDTRLSIVPSDETADGEPVPARPSPAVSTAQGTCQWPVRTDWSHYFDEPQPAILCRLGRIAPKAAVTVTVADTWSLQHCVYDDYGEASLESSWRPALLAAVNDPDWQPGPHYDFATGACPTKPGSPDQT